MLRKSNTQQAVIFYYLIRSLPKRYIDICVDLTDYVFLVYE